MTRFLLGDLPAEDRAQVEARLIEDPGYFEELAALEDEIILKWHRRELSREDRRLFAQTFFSSPERQERVDAARLLLDAAEAENDARLGSRLSRWWTMPAGLPPLAWRVALVAAAVALPVAIVVVVGGNRRLEQENALLRKQLSAAPRVVVAVALDAPGLRGEPGATDRPNVVGIPRDADEVLLRVDLTDPGGDGLDALLQPLDGGPERNLGAVRTARGASAVTVASVAIPAGELAAGDYVLSLRRADTRRSGDPESVVTRRWFRVTRD
jgi:hypothetical protein